MFIYQPLSQSVSLSFDLRSPSRNLEQTWKIKRVPLEKERKGFAKTSLIQNPKKADTVDPLVFLGQLG